MRRSETKNSFLCKRTQQQTWQQCLIKSQLQRRLTDWVDCMRQVRLPALWKLVAVTIAVRHLKCLASHRQPRRKLEMTGTASAASEQSSPMWSTVNEWQTRYEHGTYSGSASVGPTLYVSDHKAHHKFQPWILSISWKGKSETRRSERRRHGRNWTFYQEMKIEIVGHILRMDCSHVSDEIFNTITGVCSKMVIVFRNWHVVFRASEWFWRHRVDVHCQSTHMNRKNIVHVSAVSIIKRIPITSWLRFM